MGLADKNLYVTSYDYKYFELKKHEITMAGYLEYLKLKEQIENKIRRDKMSVKANKCTYYKKADSSYKSCAISEQDKPCKLLLGQKCKDFLLISSFDRFLQQYDKNEKILNEVDFVRQTLWDYKECKRLSTHSLQLDIGLSSGTIYNFLHNKKIKHDNYLLIKNFVKKIGGIDV